MRASAFLLSDSVSRLCSILTSCLPLLCFSFLDKSNGLSGDADKLGKGTSGTALGDGSFGAGGECCDKGLKSDGLTGLVFLLGFAGL